MGAGLVILNFLQLKGSWEFPRRHTQIQSRRISGALVELPHSQMLHRERSRLPPTPTPPSSPPGPQRRAGSSGLLSPRHRGAGHPQPFPVSSWGWSPKKADSLWLSRDKEGRCRSQRVDVEGVCAH